MNLMDGISAISKRLHLDVLNARYYTVLVREFQRRKSGSGISIFEDGKSQSGIPVAYPTAVAPSELLKHLPYVQYEALSRFSFHYRKCAREAFLWIKKMQAGTGSSVDRKRYLSQSFGIEPSKVHFGSKGTDLFVEIRNPYDDGKTWRCSIAEIQILQSSMPSIRK